MMKERTEKGEQVGGSYFIFRRGKKTGRISVGKWVPFEHASLRDAEEQAKKLSEQKPGEKFEVFSSTGIIHFKASSL
jgi:hypothetical protein